MAAPKKKAKPSVLFVAAEMVPFAKEGGLADVAGALPVALAERGTAVTAVLPLYGHIDRDKHGITPVKGMSALSVPMADYDEAATVHAAELPGGVTVHFIENETFFGRDGIYNNPVTGEGFEDNALRFIFFQKAVLAWMRAADFRPDVVHANDHQTALLTWYLREDEDFTDVATLFSIHNLAYQGTENADLLAMAGIPADRFYPGSPFEFYGKINMMKIGIEFADVINTVSPTYAKEIQGDEEYGCGLEGVLHDRSDDLYGIVNGVDYSVWNPETDTLIWRNYGPDNLDGKLYNKRKLQQTLGLTAHRKRVPLIGMISRLADQKGFDILTEALDDIMGFGVQLVILGAGRREYQELLLEAARRYEGRLSVNLTFDNTLAHRIEAGADIFLMPSRYEPCGLNQLYSLKYGTIPVVRATGGLADTIKQFKPEQATGTGFRFKEYSAEALAAAVADAVKQYGSEQTWRKLIMNAMVRDFSWNVSAGKYMDLYRTAIRKRTHL